MINPELPIQQPQVDPIAIGVETALRVQALLAHVSTKELTEGVEPDPDSNEVETVHILGDLVKTGAEVAIVKYTGVEEPHMHVGGEVETHVIAEGTANYVINSQASSITAGSYVVLPSEVPHFAYPTGESDEPKTFTAAVISSPTFDEEKLIPLESIPKEQQTPEVASTLAAYHEAVAA